jgi:hypothetical protein
MSELQLYREIKALITKSGITRPQAVRILAILTEDIRKKHLEESGYYKPKTKG